MIALTGASGFLGRHIARALKSHQLPHRCLVRAGSSRHQALKAVTDSILPVDFSNSIQLREALRGTKILIHALGIINGSEDDLERANVHYARNVFAAATAEGVEKIILISSVAALRRHGPYGITKFQGEEALRETGLPHTILRPAYIYGAGDENNTLLMMRTLKRYPIIPLLGGGDFKLQPVYVEDVVNLVMKAIHQPAENKAYNVAGPAQVPLRDMLVELAKGMKLKRVYLPIPLKPVQAILRLFVKIVPNPKKIPAKQILELDKHEAFDISETARDYQFRPISFAEGCRKMFADPLCAV